MGFKERIFRRPPLLPLILLALLLLGSITLAGMALGENNDAPADGHGSFPPAGEEGRAGGDGSGDRVLDEDGRGDRQQLLAREVLAREALARDSLARDSLAENILEEEYLEEGLEGPSGEPAPEPEPEPAPKPGPDPKPKTGSKDGQGQDPKPENAAQPEAEANPESAEPETDPGQEGESVPGPEPDPEGEPPPKPHTVESSGETRMLELINQERQIAGVPPLALHQDLRHLARLKSLDMYENDYFDHTSLTYGSPFDMMRDYGIRYRSAGENIATASSVERAHTNLMNSQGHRNNILNPNYNYIGIGVIRGSCKTYYITQMFMEQ